MSRSKSKGYLDSHIVIQTITIMDKVFLRLAWLKLQIYCKEVHYVEVCKRARVKAIEHRVIQNPKLTQ